MVSDAKNKIAKERLQIMTKTTDGFLISEKDLKVRGPGDFFGTRQHGLPELKIANLYQDTEILKLSQKAATELIKKDNLLKQTEHASLKNYISTWFDGKTLEL